MTSTDSTNSERLRPARRTIVKGAAWAVPAIAIAAPARAIGASVPVVPPTFTPGSACKFPGGSCDTWKHAYRAQFCMTNNTEAAILVNITEIRVNGQAKPGIPAQVSVPATGAPFCFYTLANDTGSSANGKLEFDYNYTYIDENDQVVPVSGTAGTGQQNDLPPCPDCDSGGLPGPEMQKLSTSVEEPAATTTVEEPAAKTTVDAPATDTTVEEPATADTEETTASPQG
ncbi:hypothetical protein MWU75_17750 [Ornithinimicrobium sp. F0845]|uniref:hypothetical protein n=1 Tax=Ornithinimicrobium sp. F0845 TaxID=2926412 RepID=UPI001FF49923|nr:hypothetical protein [Ornithinimicrobium sp. F0845]MCK0113989.1 hypothetical protein [Ornithinimicrobium sp. F0845]